VGDSNAGQCAGNNQNKIRSNLHTGQYPGTVTSDHSQGQALVEPLSLPEVTRHINKFLCEAAQIRGGGLIIHTSGFNCNWLKVVNVKEVITFSAI